MTIEKLNSLIKKRILGASEIGTRKLGSMGKSVRTSFKHKNEYYIASSYIGRPIMVYGLEDIINTKEDELQNILNALTRQEAIEKTKEIRNTAIKFPKKKLKLESFLNEITQDVIKKKLKKELQIASLNPGHYKTFNDIVFMLHSSDPNYRQDCNKFSATSAENTIIITGFPDNNSKITSRELEDLEDRLYNIVNTKDIEDVKAETKKIKKIAIKFPKKIFKL